MNTHITIDTSIIDFNEIHEEIDRLDTNKLLTQELYKALELNPGLSITNLLFRVIRLKYGNVYGATFDNNNFYEALKLYNNMREQERKN